MKYMSLQAQVIKFKADSSFVPSIDNAIDENTARDWQDEESQQEQQYRASAYSILAALLRAVPSEEILQHIAEFAKVAVDEDELLLSMSTMGLAAESTSLDAIDDEFHTLFIGLGRGELVPYGSWYLTGYLMEQPLSILRDDLAQLGFQRDEEIVEPEDHVAALCEVMSMMIQDNAATSVQSEFFDKHISPWIGRFFGDLSEAESAIFYRAVGRFGSAFINMEKNYLSMPV